MGSEARTRIGLGGLFFAALISFNQVFNTGDYPGPAILGILLATGIAVGMRRLGAGAVLTLLASATGLAWYLSLVFQAQHTWWTLPTRGSVEHLWLAIERAMEHSQVDYAPVPLRPGYAIQIVAGMWIAATLGELATFRWRQPLMATLVPMVLFGVALVVGTGAGSALYVALFLAMLLTYWGLESSHRVRSWGRWVSTWTHQKEAEPVSLMGALGRRIGGGAIVLALLAPLFLPALGDGLLAWRTGIGEGAGDGPGSGSARLNPWVQINQTAVEQSPTELFEMRSPVQSYWRVASLEEFDGLKWNEVSTTTSTAVGGDVDPDAAVATAGALADRTVTQEITITGLRGNGLPAAVTPTGIVQLGEDEDGGISYDLDSAALNVRDGLDEGQTFQVSSTVADPKFDEISAARPVAASLMPEIYLQIPEGVITPDIQRLLQRWTADASTPFEDLVAIQQELRGFIYTLTPDLPQTGNVLEAFLLDSRQGFCQQFATAFAVLARELGYPTRVSVGFLPGERDTTENVYTVRGTDAHAWPEVFFEGYGWVNFEPTPRSEAPPVSYTTAPGQASTGGIVGNGDSASSALNNGRGAAGPAFSEPGGTDPLRGGGLDDIGAGQGGPGSRGQRVSTAWKENFAAIVTTLGGALLLFLLAVPALKERRTRRRYAEAHSSDELAEAAFVHFQREAFELASPRRPAESALAYARRLATGGKVAEKQALRLATLYEAAAYGRSDITTEQASEARRLAGRLRSQMWAKSSWWTRAARLFSPRGLAG